MKRLSALQFVLFASGIAYAPAGILLVNDVQTYAGDGTVVFNPAGTSTSGGVTTFGNVPSSETVIVNDLTSGTFVLTGRQTLLSAEPGLFNGSERIGSSSGFTVVGGSADISLGSGGPTERWTLRGLAGVTEIRFGIKFDEPVSMSFSRGNPLPGNNNPLGAAFGEQTPGVGNSSLGANVLVDYLGVNHVTSFSNGDPVFTAGISPTVNDILLLAPTEIAGFTQLSPTSFELRGGGGFQGIHGWDDGDGVVNQPTDLDTVIDEGETNYVSGVEFTFTPGNGDLTFTDETEFIISTAGGQFNFAPIPEPSSTFMILCGLVASGLVRKRHR